jgi:DNA modification methylase
MTRRSTSTSAFGVSKRESHDATGFYSRFTPPILSEDSAVAPHRAIDKLIVGDARMMDEVPDSSVALVVTSPPYFAGKEYEESLGAQGVPGSYLEYLDLLREVFSQCVRKLEPGGRIAVNVANLGRRPYRSLSADVIGILQDDLRLLLRGEIVWMKQRGSSGSCAWGSFQRPGNPVLRDLTERVVVASKGRFDRVIPAKVRVRRGLPSESSMTREDFMENTLDMWDIPAESATRVGHPAPFPIELPARLIELYTYCGDLVLDPFVGSGTTAVAAVRANRHYAGYDTDRSYVQLAESRVDDERQRLANESRVPRPRVSLPAVPGPPNQDEDWQVRAIRDGRAAKEIARSVIEAAGFSDIQEDARQPGGIGVNFTGRDRTGKMWLFDVAGGFTSHRAGLKRTDTLWKALGKAAVLHEVTKSPLVLLTADAPAPGSAGAEALKQVTGPKKPIYSVIEMLEPSGLQALRVLSEGKQAR